MWDLIDDRVPAPALSAGHESLHDLVFLFEDIEVEGVVLAYRAGKDIEELALHRERHPHRTYRGGLPSDLSELGRKRLIKPPVNHMDGVIENLNGRDLSEMRTSHGYMCLWNN